MPEKPFFVYFAPGATHAPHHVPKKWAGRYEGQFDDGWDVQRERTFASAEGSLESFPRRPSSPLFCARQGSALDAANVRRSFRLVASAAGLDS